MTKTQIVSQLERAFVFITCETGTANRVIDHLRALDGIKDAIKTDGSYDIFVNAETTGVELLRELIDEKIRGISGILATTTLVRSKE